MIEIMKASSANIKAKANKAVIEANRVEKARPYIDAMLEKCSESIEFAVQYGAFYIGVEIDNSKLPFGYTWEEAYNLIARPLTDLGYVCKSMCGNKKINISWA